MAAVTVSAFFLPPFLFLLLLICAAPGPALCWKDPGRVLLREVQALTLHRGRYTTARRTAAVPQLQCTGGTAGCSRVPEVVQCYNKGWDGYDVQWQCKAELENSQRFGQLEVSCEGYDHPDDPYITRGSCSLLFSLELTEEGERRINSNRFHSGSYHPKEDYSSCGAGALVLLVLAVVYGIYSYFHGKCSSGTEQAYETLHECNGFFGPYSQTRNVPPPPPGFKSSFTGDNNFGTDSNHGTNSGPGFWTGLGAGGLLGYLAGSHRAQPHSPYYNTWAGATAPPPAGEHSSNSTQGGSSGTRTASGFGGTKRR
ncbi:store-operated calcium entry-associated regulatory factor [Heliangelus exortis]|uniref:store-operated calcium entry-associated regulatory factor n=1 Tax=Heliangelus exortis TaxID=472823 RepID=UPI003A8D331C